MTLERHYDELDRFKLSEGRRLWRKFLRNPIGVVGGIILLTVLVGAAFAGYFAPHEPNKQRLMARFKPPFWAARGSMTYPLGTDNVGRDIWSRIIHDSRISLLVGVSAVGVSMVIGVTLGLMAGFWGGESIPSSWPRYRQPRPFSPRRRSVSSASAAVVLIPHGGR
jgi:ABC-type dipeptide/oligopeptide/nickel transport system permease subunit